MRLLSIMDERLSDSYTKMIVSLNDYLVCITKVVLKRKCSDCANQKFIPFDGKAYTKEVLYRDVGAIRAVCAEKGINMPQSDIRQKAHRICRKKSIRFLAAQRFSQFIQRIF